MRYVTPRLAGACEPYGALCDSNLTCERHGTQRAAPNQAHQFRRQPSMAVVLAIRYCPSPLGHTVGDVVSVCAQEKMGRVATRRIVAVMQNVLPVRNQAVRQFPCDSVRPLHAPIQREDSVTIPFDAGCPRPAVVGFANADLAPKAFRDRSSRSQSNAEAAVAGARTKVGLSFFDVSLGGEKGTAALVAGSRDKLSTSHSILRDRVVRGRERVTPRPVPFIVARRAP